VFLAHAFEFVAALVVHDSPVSLLRLVHCFSPSILVSS